MYRKPELSDFNNQGCKRKETGRVPRLAQNWGNTENPK